MKIFLIALYVFLIFFLACNYKKSDMNNSLKTQDLSSYIIIDVRSKGEFYSGHLKNAINIPYDKISEMISKHVKNKNENILVYCRSGRRSDIAKKKLEKIGYLKVVNGGSYNSLKVLDQE